MTVKVIQERLEIYACRTQQEEENALKEITQEIALSALARTDFFKEAAFQGGTALRILYGLNRFSEDLDFILKKVNPSFLWKTYVKNIEDEFKTYDISVSFQDRGKVNETVKKIFLKNDSNGKILTTKFKHGGGITKIIRVKFEVDTNPPAGSSFEVKYPDFPFPFPVVVQDPPSLFAGKLHALLSREYVKGRDWYDFIWYVSRKTPINTPFLANALHQMGPWKGGAVKMSKKWLIKEMREKIGAVNWNEAKMDMIRFLKPSDLSFVDHWNTQLFLDYLEKMGSYL